MIKNILTIFQTLSRRSRFEVIYLIFFMLLSSFAELLSIAIFIPYISLLQKNDNKIDLLLRPFFGEHTILFITLFVVLITLIAGIIRLISLRWSTKVASKISTEIVYKAYNSILNKDYKFHLNESKNKLISIIHTNGSRLFYETFNPTFVLINSILFLITIFFALLFYNWEALISGTAILSIIYFYLSKRAKNVLKIQSKKQVELSRISLEKLDIELSSIEYILLGNFQKIFSNNYTNIDKQLKTSQAISVRTALFPRILIEYICLILLVIVTFQLSIRDGIDQSIPFMAGAALAIQKVFPYAQRGFESWANLSTSKESLSSLIEYLLTYNEKQSREIRYSDQINIDFSSIEFNNVNYSYKNNEEVLNNINLKLIKGDKLAIIGPSGCGKSTFLRLTCGLLDPTKGEIRLNGQPLKKNKILWMRSIGYVPQKINLTGKSLRENIVFGTKERNESNLDIEDIIEITCLKDLVKRCNGLDEEIFQNTFSLSGGENQRLAIARALYRNSKILFMDEPTASLDPLTQDIIVNNLLKIKDMTCILITHRIENMKYFDRVIEIRNKKLVEN